MTTTNHFNSFPGYKFDGRESTYRGEVTGEGGYVYAEPGVYENVALLDISSMHPTSIVCLNLFGPYTVKFEELLEARLAIKRRDFDFAKTLLDGKLAPFLTDTSDLKAADDLAYALKIVINIVYGLTSARFPNPFKDNRNKDNIVAKRGALFMIELKNELQVRDVQVIHIKTDSIKIPNCPPDIIDFIINFGKHYGYDFVHEETYDWFCLINDAVYVARSGDKWTAVGAQFQHSYVFKTVFTKEELVFDDWCETKSVTKGSMYLDFSGTGEVENMVHVGRTGSFIPVTDGGVLWRVNEDKKYAVAGTKGYLWIDRETAFNRQKISELSIDQSYFDTLQQKAIDAITQFDEVSGLGQEAIGE